MNEEKQMSGCLVFEEAVLVDKTEDGRFGLGQRILYPRVDGNSHGLIKPC